MFISTWSTCLTSLSHTTFTVNSHWCSYNRHSRSVTHFESLNVSYISTGKSKVILYYTHDKRTCLYTVNKLPHAALSGCDQQHQAYNTVRIHQMAPPVHTSINRPTTHLSPRKDERLSWPSWLTCSGRLTRIVVTDRPQAERRTGSVRRPKTGVPPTVLRNQPSAAVDDLEHTEDERG